MNYKDKKSLIIYFSRADENYFGGSMKYIDKGNTEVVAEYIRDITEAVMFKVEPFTWNEEGKGNCHEKKYVKGLILPGLPYMAGA